jgi:hypothetical protein
MPSLACGLLSAMIASIAKCVTGSRTRRIGLRGRGDEGGRVRRATPRVVHIPAEIVAVRVDWRVDHDARRVGLAAADRAA